MSNNNANPTRVITGKVRLTYAFVWEPKEQISGEEKYSTCILIPKDELDTIERINEAIDIAEERGSEKYWGKKNKGLKYPLRDGDDDDDRGDRGDEFLGHYFLNANSHRAPGIVDRYNVRIENEDEVYSGCYARVSINFYPFVSDKAKGVAVGLNNIQKIEDGEPLVDVAIAAENEFDVYQETSVNKSKSASGRQSGKAASAEQQGRTAGTAQSSGRQSVYTDDEVMNGDGDLPFGEEDEIKGRIGRRAA